MPCWALWLGRCLLVLHVVLEWRLFLALGVSELMGCPLLGPFLVGLLGVFVAFLRLFLNLCVPVLLGNALVTGLPLGQPVLSVWQLLNCP